MSRHSVAFMVLGALKSCTIVMNSLVNTRHLKMNKVEAIVMLMNMYGISIANLMVYAMRDY